MKKMRLLVLSTLLFGGAHAQNLNLDAWSSATVPTGWQSPFDGFEMTVPGEDAPVNQATGATGSGARLNPIDLSSVFQAPIVASAMVLGSDGTGMAYTTRVESVDFQAKFELAGDALGIVQIDLINGADTIGSGLANFDMAIANYTAQNVVIEYDPAFIGVNPTNIGIAAAVVGEDPTSTDANLFVDDFVLNDVSNVGLATLDANQWFVATKGKSIEVSGVDAGDVVVYNSLGQILGTAAVVNGIAVINAENSAGGFVMVQLTSGGITGVKKIIAL
jgi:hypothetical protein